MVEEEEEEEEGGEEEYDLKPRSQRVEHRIVALA